jgi:hypothetical protein
MSEEAIARYQCLARDEPHSYDHRSFENVYEVRNRKPTKPDHAMLVVPRFRRHREADARAASARRALAAILDLELYPRHKRELLSICLWKLSEAEASAKYDTRFRSASALKPTSGPLAHDHVFERRKLIARLHADPRCIDHVTELAVGCTVTWEEHRLLTAISLRHPELDGWERYRKAGVDVVDTLTGKYLEVGA